MVDVMRASEATARLGGSAASWSCMRPGRSALQHETAATISRFYSLPALSTRDALLAAAASGEIRLTDFLFEHDGMHPPPRQQARAA